ncbi:MAG TPA: hydrogenase formation protein HypD [Syntrophaceae bacterium]|nr:hydrogenase formation protein HypD [Syntrophaceae bacterium]
MKHLDEYRDRELAQRIIERIHASSKKGIRIMEVCGTHTVSIFRNGIRDVLPSNIALISGPGCPVCVTATEEIDKSIKLSREHDVIITTFGDLMRVPGSKSSLQKEKANGADIRVVYSVSDAIKIASNNPQKRVVFLGIGFETTAPTIAAAVLEAKSEGIKNFFVLVLHKLIPPAMEALLSGGDLKIDGFMCPGHVTSIIGASSYVPVTQRYHIPCVVAGFEPIDILQAIYMLVEQLEEGQAQVEIQYKRGVTFEGNKNAMAIMERVFDRCDTVWRGLGVISKSGFKLKVQYREFAAEDSFDLSIPKAKEHPGCMCGEILRGVVTPAECPLFRRTCNPGHPVGPCMVSSEGTCAAYYKYQA